VDLCYSYCSFISNISASYYSKQKIWSTPYFLIHGEHFPDASVVVPFGCAVLVLRDSYDRAKFKNRAVMMLFAHYSEDHPLFTYAVYSPRTKRIIHRQDVIFLTSVFPVRAACVASGMGPEGDSLTVFLSPPSLLDGCPADLSFGDWCVHDSLLLYDDDVTGFPLCPPYASLVEHPSALEGVPVFRPCYPSFPLSSVLVPVPAAPSGTCLSDVVPTAPPLATDDDITNSVSQLGDTITNGWVSGSEQNASPLFCEQGVSGVDGTGAAVFSDSITAPSSFGIGPAPRRST
jgi:hypothetical protein